MALVITIQGKDSTYRGPYVGIWKEKQHCVWPGPSDYTKLPAPDNAQSRIQEFNYT